MYTDMYMDKFLNPTCVESMNHLEYTTETPFPHIIIDNFLNDDVIEQARAYSKSLKLGACDTNRLPPNKTTQYKYGYNNIKKYPDNIKSLFTFLSSKEFINKIEDLTGINNLIPENSALKGSGFHKIAHKGFLNLHTDFNNYDDEVAGSLDRRINLLIYLNPGWENDYNGHLWLCDKTNKKTEKKVLPILNRCVIFSTTNKSIHGHPERLNVPEGVTRDSIAFYYYTKNTTRGTCFEGDKFHSTIYYNTKDFIE